MTQNCQVRRFLKDTDGGPAAELALVALPLAVIFVLIMQFGILLFIHNDMFNAARIAAREMAANEALNYTTGDTTCGSQPANFIEDIACDAMDLWNSFATFTVRITVTKNPAADPACEQIEVMVSTPMSDATLFNIFDLLDGLTLGANMIVPTQHDMILADDSAGSGPCIYEP